jgi:hypothetical protein
MTNGGVWYSFNCIGKNGVITSAREGLSQTSTLLSWANVLLE